MSTTPALSSSVSPAFVQLPPGPTHGPLSIEYQWLNTHLTQAPLAVFLHEGLGSVAMWKAWPQVLCDALGMRGLVYSRPGYGRSTPRAPETKWPVDFMAHQARDVLPALLDALQIGREERRRMWLIGHSDGGSIALLYASAFPDELAGAVVIAPHVFVEDVSVESIAEAKLTYETTDLRRKLARYHDDVDSAFYGWNDIWLSPAFRAWNIVAELPAIACPVLALQAIDDHYGTMAQVETIAEQVPDAQLGRLERGGHSPHAGDASTLNQAICTFMKSVRIDRPDVGAGMNQGR